jgi:hypothetical protein
MLLLRYEEHEDQLLMELSLPRTLGATGVVSDWQERIILQTIRFDEIPMFLRSIAPGDEAASDDETDIDIPVERRA